VLLARGATSKHNVSSVSFLRTPFSVTSGRRITSCTFMSGQRLRKFGGRGLGQQHAVVTQQMVYAHLARWYERDTLEIARAERQVAVLAVIDQEHLALGFQA